MAWRQSLRRLLYALSSVPPAVDSFSLSTTPILIFPQLSLSLFLTLFLSFSSLPCPPLPGSSLLSNLSISFFPLLFPLPLFLFSPLSPVSLSVYLFFVTLPHSYTSRLLSFSSCSFMFWKTWRVTVVETREANDFISTICTEGSARQSSFRIKNGWEVRISSESSFPYTHKLPLSSSLAL